MDARRLTPRRARLRRAATVVGVLLASALLVDQSLHFTVLRDGELAGRRIAPFDPPLFTPAQHASLARIRAQVQEGAAPSGDYRFDAELGWGPRRDGAGGPYATDWAGCRLGVEPLARERDPRVARIVTIGCSFTYGAEVFGHETWPAVLDAACADLEVANLAMGAYGLDQALLRWRSEGRVLAADEVWLGFLPTALMRNVTVYSPAMRHWTPSVDYKPRFVLDERDALVLVPNPVRSLADVVGITTSQAAFVAAVGASDFVVRSHPVAYAPAGSSLLHRFASTRLWVTHAERLGRDSDPWLADAASEPYRVARAIVLAAQSEVEASGARFRLLLLPDRPSLAKVADGKRGPWQALLDDLSRARVDVLDLSTALLAGSALDDDGAWAPGGHYSARGNAIVAAALENDRRTRPRLGR